MKDYKKIFKFHFFNNLFCIFLFFFICFNFLENFNLVYSKDQKSEVSKENYSVNNSARKSEGYIYHTSNKLFYDAKNKVFELSGNVKIFYKDTKISCQSFRYFEEKKYGFAQGNPRLYNPKVFVKSDFVEVFFENKRVVAQKNVYVRIKNTNKKNKDEPDYFELYTNKLFYNWENENVFVPEKVKIVSKDIYLTANQLVYNGKTKTIILKGNVKGKGKDQYIQADRLIYNLEKDSMTMEGNVKSVIKVSEKEKEESNSSEEILLSMAASEIYQAVLKSNQEVVDYFIKKDGFIPIIDIYLNQYTTIEIYKELLNYKPKYSIYDLEKSKIVFIPLGYKELIEDNIKNKIVAWYIYSLESVFFENYKESVDYIKKHIYSEKVILFSNPQGLNIAIFNDEDKKNWYKEFFYNTVNENFVKGYWFSFQDLNIFYSFKDDLKDKEVFFVIDKYFWQNFNKNKGIVFDVHQFKTNLLINLEDVKSLNYNTEEFLKFLFWKSFLYNCSLYVNQDVYNLKQIFKQSYFNILEIEK